jgi:hydrogenase nickel incorporation protein HypA/HybF
LDANAFGLAALQDLGISKYPDILRLSGRAPQHPKSPNNFFACPYTPQTKRLKPIRRNQSMHEMGVAMQIIEIASASIPKNMALARVERVNLKVGKLSAIVSDSLRFCFEIAAKDTQLEGAELKIDEIPVVAHCNDCGFQWSIEEPVFTCKKCTSGSIELLSGRELDIESIEIAEKEKFSE